MLGCGEDFTITLDFIASLVLLIFRITGCGGSGGGGNPGPPAPQSISVSVPSREIPRRQKNQRGRYWRKAASEIVGIEFVPREGSIIIMMLRGVAIKFVSMTGFTLSYGQKTHPCPLKVMTGGDLKDLSFPLVYVCFSEHQSAQNPSTMKTRKVG